jgi:hypothetical protein
LGALPVIISLLNSLLSLVPAGTALFEKFTAQKTQAEQWAASNYVPTDADWATLDADVKSLEAQIDAAAQG